MKTVISHSETWLVESLFYPVVLPWFIEKFRSWNKVNKDKNKKVNLINTITNFFRISRGLFLWSAALFIEYLVHRRVNSIWQPKKQGRIPLFIKSGNVRLKNYDSNVFMTFLWSPLRKNILVASFAEHPVNRPIWH